MGSELTFDHAGHVTTVRLGDRLALGGMSYGAGQILQSDVVRWIEQKWPKYGPFAQKDCAVVLEAAITHHGVRALYHFTDRRNLDSIRSCGGLYSWRQCQTRGIAVAAPGGDNMSHYIDHSKGLSDYVHLSFCQDHPMMHKAQGERRLGDCEVLTVDTRVVLWKTTLFSDRNALDRQAQVGATLEDFRRIRLDVVGRPWTNEEDKKLFQAEVLVHAYVPREFITRADGSEL